MRATDAAGVVRLLAGRRVLVVGDAILDGYWIGAANRLSREAPVPVLELQRQFHLPGGAANPAANIVALGGWAALVAAIGADEEGRRLAEALAAHGIDTGGLVTVADRITPSKTRLLAESSLRFPQHLARLDRIPRAPLDAATEQALCQAIASLAPQADALLLSDYKCGVITPKVTETALWTARQHRLLAAVDSQGDLTRFRGFDVVKCNRSEAEAQCQRTLDGDTDFERACAALVPDLGVRTLIITRGADGMTVAERGRPPAHLSTTNRSEVFDATGAGDTVIAVVTMALAAGLDARTAAHLANVAAGLAVRRLGNATVTPEELIHALETEAT